MRDKFPNSKRFSRGRDAHHVFESRDYDPKPVLLRRDKTNGLVEKVAIFASNAPSMHRIDQEPEI